MLPATGTMFSALKATKGANNRPCVSSKSPLNWGWAKNRASSLIPSDYAGWIGDRGAVLLAIPVSFPAHCPAMSRAARELALVVSLTASRFYRLGGVDGGSAPMTWMHHLAWKTPCLSIGERRDVRKTRKAGGTWLASVGLSFSRRRRCGRRHLGEKPS